MLARFDHEYMIIKKKLVLKRTGLKSNGALSLLKLNKYINIYELNRYILVFAHMLK